MSEPIFHPPCEVRGGQRVYQVDAFLGRGGFGESYRGRADGQPVTLKVLRPERLESWKAFDLFEREARALGTLDHPGVPRLVELFPLERERVVLVSTFVPGRSLQAILDGGERLDAARAERLARELLDVLGYLHTRPEPVIHRDIKPSNVVIDDGGRAHLIDFGAIQTKILAAGAPSGSTMIGTLGYFPQEQLLGRAVPASDLYALGMTLVAAITGKPPEQQPFNAATGKVTPPAGLPPGLSRFLYAVLEPAPGTRPASAVAARAVLDGSLQIVTPDQLAIRTPPAELTKQQKVQRWMFRGVLGAGAAGAGAINLLMFNEFSETELVQLAPFWVAPMVFGAAGLVALPRRGAVAIAFASLVAGLVLLWVFLVGIFPAL